MPLFGSLNEMPPECQSDFLLIKKGFQESKCIFFIEVSNSHLHYLIKNTVQKGIF